MDQLKIPPDVEDTLLPSETTPVALLSIFPVPGQQNPNIPTLVHPTLSEQRPSVGIDQLIHHATPSADDVAHLRALFLRPDCNARSVSVPRPGRHEDPPRYPLWVLTYWLRLSVVRHAKKEWAEAMQHLQKLDYKRVEKQTSETSSLVARVFDVLHTLPWASTIEGFSVQFPSVCLATYLSTKWLSSDHEDHMLSLLHRDLLVTGHRSSTTVEDTTFVQKLHDAYAHRSDAYTLSSSHSWVRGRGNDLAEGRRSRLGTIGHTGGNHWVALVFDFEQSIVYFGDSLGGKMSSSLQQSIGWWTHFHSGVRFTFELLPISRQLDGFSCGLLAWNALCAFLLHTVSLIPVSTVRNVNDERIKVFLRIIERRNEHSFNDSPSVEDPVSALLAYGEEQGTLTETMNVTASPPPPTSSPRVSNGNLSSPAGSPRMLSRSSPSPSSMNLSYPPSPDSFTLMLSPAPSPSREPTPTTPLETAAPLETVAPLATATPATPATSVKRKNDQRQSLSKSPEQKKRTKKTIHSTTRKALAGDVRRNSVLQFFKLTTTDGHQADMDRDAERDANNKEIVRQRAQRQAEIELQRKRERAKERKRSSRANQKQKSIAAGELNPDGTKLKKTITVELRGSPTPQELAFTTVAQHTRAARTITAQKAAKKAEKASTKTKKPVGRPPTKVQRPATYHNWLHPLTWVHIRLAGLDAGWQMKPVDIAKALVVRDPYTFKSIRATSVREWIDFSGERPKWKESTLRRCGVTTGHSKGGRKGVFAAYPELINLIKSRLQKLRDASAPVTVVTARGLIVATVLESQPEIFAKIFRDGSKFKVSDSFVRGWLKDSLGWSRRKATRAAHKLPVDWEAKCTKSFFRKAYSVKEHDIPAPLFVNSDQTQIVYAPGDKMTYAETGSKQVSLVGAEEKRAFTLMVSIASDGTVLPFQAIYVGKTNQSCPSTSAPFHFEATEAGFIFCASGTKTYWSNQTMMREFVEKILAPYFETTKVRLGLPPEQRSLWTIDVWSVHRSGEFRMYMRATHPTIILDFVPGGCTGVDQPCDVGIQRPLKLSLKRSYHEDIVETFLQQIRDESDIVRLDDNLGAIRDRSVQWLWRAHAALSDVELVKKAFSGCKSNEWDLSYETLVSFSARQALRNMKDTDPDFWQELVSGKVIVPAKNVKDLPEDALDDDEDGLEDDSDVQLASMKAFLLQDAKLVNAGLAEDGSLQSKALAESLDDDDNYTPPSSIVLPADQPLRRGGRERQVTTRYGGDFWRHDADNGSDEE